MAKKKTTIVEEEVETPKETPEKEINYEKDIKDKSIEEVALDLPAKEEPKETPKEEPKKEEYEEIEFDPQKLKEEAKAEAKQELADLISGKTAGEKEVVRDEYEEWANKIFQDTGKEPTWKEAADFIKEKAKSELRAEADAEVKKQADEKVKQDQIVATEQERVDKYVDDQFDQLYNTNQFPRIQNKEDQNDTGVVFRKSLAEQTMRINKERLDKGLPTKTLMEVFFTEFKRPNAQPAGANAPISAGRSGAVDNQEEIDYLRDVRGPRSFMEILMRRKK